MFHVSLDIAGVTRINAAARNQPLCVFLYIVGNELIDLRSESHQLGRYVVDEDRAIYSDLIEMMKKFLRRMAEFDDLVKVRPLLLHHRQSRGLEHLYGLDVNVAVGDHRNQGVNSSSKACVCRRRIGISFCRISQINESETVL